MLTLFLRKIQNAQETLRMTTSIGLGCSNGNATFDELRVLPDGSIWIAGWSAESSPALASVIRGGEPCALRTSYRTFRPDVAAALGSTDQFLGFEAIYVAPVAPANSGLQVRVGDALIHESRVEMGRGTPHYDALLDSSRVFRRDDIYGSGPPVAAALAEVIALTAKLQGKVLDFGCGAGFLVAQMRARGVDAQGIEIDRPEIRQHLMAEAAQYVKLYDGSLPLPYADGSFDSVTSMEVLEHIPHYESIVPELARIARDRLIVTVPDASAIPQLFHANVVPWHLLESTHFNFFTPQSLTALLAPHFSEIRLCKIGTNHTNGIPWNTSLVALCRKQA